MASARHGHWVGDKPSRMYKTWVGMKQRCLNINYPQYHYYGGRGITVCERWMDFNTFLADMGDRPEGKSLDRKDNSKGYYLENCHWVDNIEQQRNRRNVKMTTEAIQQVKLQYATGKITQRELAFQYGCSPAAISNATRKDRST